MGTGAGAGAPGGMGIRLKYSNPMYLDDVAADFRDMPIIVAQTSLPWLDEAMAVATHKPNVYIDLSGWSPKYFPANLVQYSNTLLKDRMLFGSDYPVLTPDRWLADITLFGSATKVRDGVEAWRAAGIKTPILVPLSADGDQKTALRQVFAAFSD